MKTVKEVCALSKTSTKQAEKAPRTLLPKPLPFIAKTLNNENSREEHLGCFVFMIKLPKMKASALRRVSLLEAYSP